MVSTEYYDILRRYLDPTLTVRRIVHGISWTAAVLSNGQTGVAMHTEGESYPRMFESLEGLSLDKVGEALMSWNMEEASEALAAVNACYNTSNQWTTAPEVKTLDGIDLTGRTVGFVGHLIGHSNITAEMLKVTKAYYIMEKEPKPGDYPDSACEFLLPKCDLVIITGSAAINKTLPRLLELSQNALTVLTGPSVTCCQELLSLGIQRLNGRTITQPQPMLSAIVEQKTSVNMYSLPFQLEQ